MVPFERATANQISYCNCFGRRMEEKRQKKRGGYFSLIGEKYSHMRGRNPHLPKKMPQWFKRKFQTKWLYGIHPQMPVFKKFVDKDPRIQTTPYKQY